mgnify:CR=1 FL=1
MVSEVSLRQLNRWTLGRQLLLERSELDAVTAIARLAGMQAQYSPSPYIGLWSRLRDFRREELEAALLADQVYKATLMRGTLHLVAAHHFDRYRVTAPSLWQVYANTARLLRELDVDVDAVRAAIHAAVRERPRTRQEAMQLARQMIPAELNDYVAWGTVALASDLIIAPEDAHFGRFGGSRYRMAPPVTAEAAAAYREVVVAYLAAFGPASRADLAQWSGQPVAAFAAALETLDLVTLNADDGRILLDLADAPRTESDIPAPVRFLPKWDNLLLAYERRARVLPEALRRIVIRKNGDVLPTFLVEGMVAGTWEAPLRGRAVMTLSPLGPLTERERAQVEQEAESLLAWLRPDTDGRDVRWATM